MKMQIDNEHFCLVVDLWSGSGDTDEKVLWDNGVRGMYVRLNDMNGGHKLDKNFQKQWSQGSIFAEAPYFVYNPWVNGQENFNFLNSVMPVDAAAVIPDMEVRYTGSDSKLKSPAYYAGEFEKFRLLCLNKWDVPIYTGGGYTSIMSKWPVCDYLWARYPYAFLPQTAAEVYITWEQLKAKLAQTEWNPGMTLKGNTRVWQLADHYILPGCPHPIDINVFKGSFAELQTFFNKKEAAAKPAPLDIYHISATAGLKVRNGPSLTSDWIASLSYLTYGKPTQVTVYEKAGLLKEWSRIDPVEQKWVSSLWLSKN